MKNHSGCDRRGSILPIPFLRAIFTSSDDHVGDVLCVRHIARREQTNFSERVEAGTRVFLNRRELEAAISKPGPKTCRFGPVFALDVVHNCGFFPCEKRWNYQPDSFAGTGWCERRDGRRPVGPQVVEPPRTFWAPAAQVNSAPCINEPGLFDIV